LKLGALHGGDNDTTGTIACAWWGAIYGFEGVPRRIWENVEKRQLADVYGKELFKLRYSGQDKT
jgi:ADP-ribosylarginine hydrolase